jgi:hypothetical protein
VLLLFTGSTSWQVIPYLIDFPRKIAENSSVLSLLWWVSSGAAVPSFRPRQEEMHFWTWNKRLFSTS